MFNKLYLHLFLLFLCIALSACAVKPDVQMSYDPGTLRFSGDRAMELEREFVTRFPNRHSGQPNNRLAMEWLIAKLTDLGWSCRIDEWEIINYSRPVALNNAVCRLPGKSDREILVVAHHDQAPTTIQGADNNGSGVAILLHLAEVFANENPLHYTLVFAFTDAEEYGMIGSRRYVETHPNLQQIIAGISLDNLGRTYYDGVKMELVGQYDGYGALWLALTAREAARAAGLWDVYLRSTFDQVTDQAAPVSLMDQGPLVAASIPAIGFAGHFPESYADENYRLWHDPDDTLDYQSANVLGKSGLTAEALIRQLLSMDKFPKSFSPYLYFDSSGQVLQGLPLWLIFCGFVIIFFLGSLLGGKTSIQEKLLGWRFALPHFLGLWMPLLASIILLYVFVWVGLMDRYHAYPATTKDPALLHPRWPAVILFLLGLGVFFYLGRRLVRDDVNSTKHATHIQIMSLSMFIIGLSGVYVLWLNPFALLFFVPLLFWLLIAGRRGVGKILDLLLFLLGGLVVYALIYVFGFITLRYNLAFLWFMMNMFSIRMISFPTAAMITAIIGAGLALVVNPPIYRGRSK